MQIPARLFFAIVPPDSVREACEAATRDLVMKMQPGGYKTRPDKYHMTIMYLGDALTPEQQMKAVQAGHLIRGEPFSMQLNLACSFTKNKKPPLLLVPGIHPDGLLKLRSEVLRHCKAVGFESDHSRFSPHVTICRDITVKFAKTAIKPIPWDVSEILLLRSPVVGERGGVYDEVARWKLRDAPLPGEQGSLL